MVRHISQLLLDQGDLFELRIQKHLHLEFQAFISTQLESFLTYLVKKKKYSAGYVRLFVIINAQKRNRIYQENCFWAHS